MVDGYKPAARFSGSSDYALTTRDKIANWARGRSLWPLSFGTACCSLEMLAAMGGRFELGNATGGLPVVGPRHADLMIVSGRISAKMVPVLKDVYAQIPEPKWVIAMGVCAISGGAFNSYATVQGIDRILPVDICVAGCPPRPEDLIEAVRTLQQDIRKTPYRSFSRQQPI